MIETQDLNMLDAKNHSSLNSDLEVTPIQQASDLKLHPQSDDASQDQDSNIVQ